MADRSTLRRHLQPGRRMLVLTAAAIASRVGRCLTDAGYASRTWVLGWAARPSG
jgi:hypothetical protein